MEGRRVKFESPKASLGKHHSPHNVKPTKSNISRKVFDPYAIPVRLAPKRKTPEKQSPTRHLPSEGAQAYPLFGKHSQQLPRLPRDGARVYRPNLTAKQIDSMPSYEQRVLHWRHKINELKDGGKSKTGPKSKSKSGSCK